MFTNVHSAIFHFFFPYYEHVRYFFHLSLAYFITDFFVALIQLDAHAGSFEFLAQGNGIVHALFRNRQELDLNRSKPRRKLTGIVFEQHADEAPALDVNQQVPIAQKTPLRVIAEVLADVVGDAAPEAEQAGCRIALDAETEVPVRGDAEMLHRVFDNLVRNALAYAAGGGWIGVRVEPYGDDVCVCVEDRGPGVLSSDLKRLFEPFFRGSQVPVKKGHGLGLAIARQIVLNHHGRIDAENRREGGLRVTVRLPRASPETGA